MKTRWLTPPSREEILGGPALRTILRIGTPSILTSLLGVLYNLTSAYWVGHLHGEDAALAGIQSSGPFIWFLVSLFSGFAIAAATAFVAQNLGANRPEDANYAVNQLVTVGLVGGVVIGSVGYFLTPWMTKVLVGQPAVAHEAAAYLSIIFLGIHTIMLPQLISSAFWATGDTITPLVVNLVGVAINIPLARVLVLGSGSIPQMGIVGSAYANVAAQSVPMVIFFVLLGRGRGVLKLKWHALRIRWAWMSKALRVGLPAGLAQASVAFGFLLVNGAIGHLSNAEAALTGYGVADRVFGLLFIATDGLGIGLTTMIGQAIGAGMMDRARELARKGIAMLLAVVCVEAAVVYFARYPLVSVFIPNQTAAVREGVSFIQLFAASMPFLSLFFSAEAIYRAAGRNWPPLFLGVLRLWVFRIPLTYAFAYFLGMGSDGAWLGMSLSNVLSGIVASGFLVSRRWQHSLIEPTPSDEETAT